MFWISNKCANSIFAWIISALCFISFIAVLVAHSVYVHYDVPKMTMKAAELARSECEESRADCTMYIKEMESWAKKYYEADGLLFDCMKDLARCQNESHIDCMSIEPRCE